MTKQKQKRFQSVLKEQIVEQDPTQNFKIDPNIVQNDIVKNKLRQLKFQQLITRCLISMIATSITAPLNTISTSLQLSVKQHKHAYDKPENTNTKELLKLNKELTIQQKRQFQMQIRSNVDNKPFTAPVYLSYKQAFRGIFKQGWLAFFKGNVSRTIYQTLNHTYQESMKPLLDYTVICLLDICTNSLRIAQNRFILQNCTKEFRTYSNLRKYFKKQLTRQMYLNFSGASVYPVINFVTVYVPMTVALKFDGSENQSTSIFMSTYLGFLMAYPFWTSYKRFVCQSDSIGMIPDRYKSIFHGIHLIFYEEGLRGLYRGAIAGALCNSIFATILYSGRQTSGY